MLPCAASTPRTIAWHKVLLVWGAHLAPRGSGGGTSCSHALLQYHLPLRGTKCYWCGVHIWSPMGLEGALVTPMRVMLKHLIPLCGTKCYWCGVHIWPPVGLEGALVAPMSVMLKHLIPLCGTKCYWCGVHICPPRASRPNHHTMYLCATPSSQRMSKVYRVTWALGGDSFSAGGRRG